MFVLCNLLPSPAPSMLPCFLLSTFAAFLSHLIGISSMYTTFIPFRSLTNYSFYSFTRCCACNVCILCVCRHLIVFAVHRIQLDFNRFLMIYFVLVFIRFDYFDRTMLGFSILNSELKKHFVRSFFHAICHNWIIQQVKTEHNESSLMSTTLQVIIDIWKIGGNFLLFSISFLFRTIFCSFSIRSRERPTEEKKIIGIVFLTFLRIKIIFIAFNWIWKLFQLILN